MLSIASTCSIFRSYLSSFAFLACWAWKYLKLFIALLLLNYSRIQRGYTALICAAANGHTECLQLLLEAGVEKEARDKVRSLILCVNLCNMVVNLLSWLGLRLSLLFFVVLFWFHLICFLLVSKSFLQNLPNKPMQIQQKKGTEAEHRKLERNLGWTALIHASANGHANCVRVLLEKKANTNANQYVRYVLIVLMIICSICHKNNFWCDRCLILRFFSFFIKYIISRTFFEFADFLHELPSDILCSTCYKLDIFELGYCYNWCKFAPFKY